ncbi:MAG: cyclic nucleotide-binding domain-containing protein [Anaerolineae bacterium]|nr:cyclic nucleotide-binding domain-containing protein [Anaerolineae bacterium]
MTIEPILKEVPFFSRLSDDVLKKLAGMGQTITMKENQVVYQEGDESESMFVILNGRVKIYKVDEQGYDLELTQMDAGDFFGELALLDSRPRSATVVCLTPCEFFIINQIAFMGLLLGSRAKLVYGVFADLTGKIRDTTEAYFKEELAKQMLQAEMKIERHRSLAQMVAGVAHELNTPLGIVNTAVDMIAKRVQSDALAAPLSGDKAAQAILADMQEAAHLASRNISRAHNLVQNFKKISVNQLTAVKETVDLTVLVQDILELFKINARQANLTIEVIDHLPEGNKVWIGYPGYLTQVLTNLLFNIEKYAYPDGNGGIIEIELSMAPERDPAHFMLTVQDYGRGIAPENLSQIFTPFFTTGRRQGGTGLGLAIVHNIVTDALKGKITVESDLNVGTTFTVIFPQIVAHDKESGR